MQLRRVVTGLDARGHATVVSDAAATDVMSVAAIPGWEIATVGATPRVLIVPTAADPPARGDQLEPGATRFLIWRLPPVEAGPNPAGMHCTDTVDYIVVLSGSVSMVMGGGGEVELRAGDCLVQNGTAHEWINRSGADCVMAVVMVGARRS